MSTQTLESQKQSTTPMRPIAHLPGPSERKALCGAELVGLPATGAFDKCVVCDELWPAARRV